MSVESGLRSLNYRVVTVDPDGFMIVRDREGKDLPVQLLPAVDQSKQFDDRSHGERHAVSILPISHVERSVTTLDLACQERKIQVVC